MPITIDWVRIANDIKEAGMSYNRQANEIGMGWSTMQRWLEPGGPEPRFADGANWINLHIRMCGVEMTRSRILST